MEVSVAIIGSGIGGATTAYALAKKGIETLILERGDYLPKEPENWSAQAIFIDKRYKPDETWLDISTRKRLRKIGLSPFPNAMGIDLGMGGKCIRSPAVLGMRDSLESSCLWRV